MRHSWQKMAVSIVLAGVVSLIAASSAAGQEANVGVIRRAEEVAGKGTWSLVGLFSSAGEAWSGVDLWGDPYTAVQTIDRRRLTMAASVCLDEYARFGAALNLEQVQTAILMEANTSSSEERRSDRAVSFSIHAEFIGDSGSQFDPRVRLSLGSSRTQQCGDCLGMWFGIAGSASYILDPMVFAGTLDWSLSNRSPSQWLAVSISVGLVANSRVTIALEASLSHAVAAVAIPTSTITMRTSVSLTADRSRRIEMSVAIHPGSQGQTMAIGFGIRGTTT